MKSRDDARAGSRRSPASLRIVMTLAALASVAFVGSLQAADAPAAETDAPSPRATLEGRVVDPEGNALAGATVIAVSAEAKPVRRPRGLFAPRGADGREHPVAETRTDEEGLFSVEVEGASPFLLRADADGFAPSRTTRVEAGEAPTLRLSKGWTVRGRVFDATTGKPLAGAEVEARGTITDGLEDEEHPDRFARETVTDDEGGFEIANLEPNYYRVRAVADGYAEDLVSRLEVGLQEVASEAVYLYLIPGVTIEGVVARDDGSPVEGARVGLRPEQTIPSGMARWARSGGFSAKSDENGEFTLRGVPVAPSYALEASHEELAPAAVTGIRVGAGRTSSPIRVVLTPGTSLVARLLADGKPFEGDVSVSLAYAIPGSGFTPRVARTGDTVELENGKLTARRIPTGKARLTIAAEGYEEVVRDEVRFSAGETLDLGEILLETGASIGGRVLDDRGEPLPNAEVAAMSFAAGAMARKTAGTDDRGSFRIGGLGEVAYTVSAEAEGYGRGTVKDVKPGGEPVEIRLEKAGSIRGRVMAGDPPKPVGGFAVESQGGSSDLPMQMQMLGLDRSRMDFRDPAGEFVVGGLAAGAYKLEVVANGFMPARLDEVAVEGGETVDLGDVVLERGATLNGTVREKGSGRPIGGATVRVEEPGLFSIRRLTEIDVAELTTGPDGRFTLAGLAPGRHTIVVEHERFSKEKRVVEVSAGVPPDDASIELSSGGAVEGTYRDKDGKLVSGGMVMVMQGFVPDPNSMVSTDEYGHFRVDHLPPGTYRVMAMPQPGGPGQDQAAMLAQLQMQTVEVEDGKTSIVNVPPEAGAIVVNGTVRKGSRRIEARLLWVRVASDGATPEDFAAAVSDGNGDYEARLSGPGEYRVSVQPLGEEQDTAMPGMVLKVEIPEEERVLRDLVIPDVVLSGDVVDAYTGERLGGVSVAALEHRDDRLLRESVLAASTQTDEEGRYRLEGLREDTYRLTFSKEGYGAQALEPLELDGESEEEGLDVSLVPADEVRVRVTDRDGNEVEGALVTALGFPALAVAGTTGQTDPDGTVVLAGLGEGAHDLGVVVAGYAPTVSRDVLVPTEDGAPVVIELPEGAPLTLRLVDTEKRPVSKAAVRIRQEGGADLTSLVAVVAIFEGRGLLTGPHGELRFPDLEPGRYALEIRWREVVIEEKVRVRSGRENELSVTLRDRL